MSAPNAQPPASQKQQPPPPSSPTGEIAAATAAGALLPTAATLAAGVPALTVPPAAAAGAVAAIVGAFDAFNRKRRRQLTPDLTAALVTLHPERPKEQLQTLVRSELLREREFQRKQKERLHRDLTAALNLDTPDKRRLRVQAVLDRERRYSQMREEAMLARAHARAAFLNVKDASPLGAYWKLGDTKTHTPDCVAMAGKFWPWVVLNAIHPLLHPGCACDLVPFDDAVRLGYMHPDQVPDTEDAVKRAHDIATAHRIVSEAAYAWEIDEYVEALREGLLTHQVYRYAKGTHQGGEFAPRGAVGTPSLRGRRMVHDALRRLIPHWPNTPAERRRDSHGEWREIAGRQVFVPEHRAFEREIGGRKWYSPPGSTKVYEQKKLLSPGGPIIPPERGSELTDTAMRMRVQRREEARAAAARALEQQDRMVKPAESGAPSKPTHGGMLDAGFHTTRQDVSARSMTFSYEHPASGAQAQITYATQEPHRVTAVVWHPGRAEHKPSPPLDRPPRSWEEFTTDVANIASDIAKQHGVSAHVTRVIEDESKYDHAAEHDWHGVIHLGVDMRPSINALARARSGGDPLSFNELRDVYATYRTAVHEALHGVNPIDKRTFTSHGVHRGIEEALVEELASVYTVDVLRRQGLDEVLRWLKANPTDTKVESAYSLFRRELDRSLVKGDVPPEKYRSVLEALKFSFDPPQRPGGLASLAVHGGDEGSIDNAEKEILQRFSRADMKTDEGATLDVAPLLRPRLEDVPDAEPVWMRGERVFPGQWVDVQKPGQPVAHRGQVERVRERDHGVYLDVRFPNGVVSPGVTESEVKRVGSPPSGRIQVSDAVSVGGQDVRPGDTVSYLDRMTGDRTRARVERIIRTRNFDLRRPEQGWQIEATTLGERPEPVLLTGQRAPGLRVEPDRAMRSPGESADAWAHEVEVTGWNKEGESVAWTGRGATEDEAIADAQSRGGIIASHVLDDSSEPLGEEYIYRPSSELTRQSPGEFRDPNTIAVPTGLGPVTFVSSGDQVGPEYHALYVAQIADGTPVGHVNVSYLGDTAAIQMIEVPEQYRRQGVASALVQRIRNEQPDVKIETLGDVATPEGRAFVAAGRRSHYTDDEELAQIRADERTRLQAETAKLGTDANVMYHVAPVNRRRQIQQNGLSLEAARRHSDDKKPGNYLWDSFDHAWKYATTGDRMYGDADIWAVRANEHKTEPDPFFAKGAPMAERAAHVFGDSPGAHVTRENVPPRHMFLHWPNPWYPEGSDQEARAVREAGEVPGLDTTIAEDPWDVPAGHGRLHGKTPNFGEQSKPTCPYCGHPATRIVIRHGSSVKVCRRHVATARNSGQDEVRDLDPNEKKFLADVKSWNTDAQEKSKSVIKGLKEAHEVMDEVARVAASVASFAKPDYGQCGWDPESKTVWWNSADYTSNAEIEAARRAFLAIDGVEYVDVGEEGARPAGFEIVQAVSDLEEGHPRHPQRCKYGKHPATKSLVWAEGMAYVPVCDAHEEKARHKIEVENHDEVLRVLPISEAATVMVAPGTRCAVCDDNATHVARGSTHDVFACPNHVDHAESMAGVKAEKLGIDQVDKPPVYSWLSGPSDPALVAEAEWDPLKHPRGRGGKWTHVQVKLHGQKPFMLRVTHESDKEIRGVEVGKTGDEVVPKGASPSGERYTDRMHIIGKGGIEKLTPHRMNNTYGELEPIPEGERDNPVDVHGDVALAAKLLAEGKHVRLEQPHEVSTLLDKLAQMVEEAKQKGEKAPNFDLCKVSVKGTNLFCEHSKGVPRLEMPQFKGMPLPGSKADALEKNEKGRVALDDVWREHLRGLGVKVEQGTEKASYLRATQHDLSGANVARIAHEIEQGRETAPIFVSSDNYILDGHHQWAAKIGAGVREGGIEDVSMPVERIDMPITDLLTEAKKFTEDFGMRPQSSTDRAETVEPRPWADPPPPVGSGERHSAGGYSSDAAYGTNTALGRIGEQAFTDIVGGRVLHPEGKGEQSPLDVHFDGYGFEVKAVSTKSVGYKATPKQFEVEQKAAFAKQLGVKPALAIVVIDSDGGQAHAYMRDGLQGGRLSKNTGWQFLGSAPLPNAVERAHLSEAAWEEMLHPRGRLGRWVEKLGVRVEHVDRVGAPQGAHPLGRAIAGEAAGSYIGNGLIHVSLDALAKMPEERRDLVIAHEVGRALWEHKGPSMFRARAAQEMQKALRAEPYFREDPQEAFSEGFARHVMRGEHFGPLSDEMFSDGEQPGLRKVSEFVQLPKSGKLATAGKPVLDALDRTLRVPDMGERIPVKATAGKNARGGFRREEKGTIQVQQWEGPVVGRGRSAVPAKRADEFVAGEDGHAYSHGDIYPVVKIEPQENGSLKFTEKSPSSEFTYERIYKPDDLVGFDWSPKVTGESKLEPGKISVSARDQDENWSMEGTLAHELGHFIDNAAFRRSADGHDMESLRARFNALPDDVKQEYIDEAKSRGDEAAALARRVEGWRADPGSPLSEWWNAVTGTKEYEALGKANMMDIGTHQYLRRPSELWARSFFQWLATRSQEPTLMGTLRHWQQLPEKMTKYTENWKGEKTPYEVDTPGHLRHRQWSDEEFEPVGKAMDAAFEKLGWRQHD